MAWETHYCSSCGGTGESFNPIVGRYEGVCRSCKGTGEVKVNVRAATPAPPDDTKADRAGSPQGGQ